MSEAWNEGYFTEVGYTYGYYRELNPVFQRFCLLLRGLGRPPAGADDHHCELGFGQGVSVNIHAAANPGTYIGTDFNPGQTAHANSLARASGNNALLADDSFEQLLERPGLPQFDSISLHGIWTWVSLDNQKIIVEFARRHLKPGGVFYISYNCFPGWAPAYPLRQLFSLHDRFAGSSPVAENRVDAALTFTQSLLEAAPGYMKAVPGLPARLKKIMEQDRRYLAHEYFNREWNCMYFTDVVDALEPAKLEFAGTAVPFDAVDAVNLTAEGSAFLKTIQHPLMREQARDYFVNQQFRKDLYVRGAIRLTPAEQAQQWLESRFVLLAPAEEVPLKFKAALGEATLQESVYRPVIAALAEGDHVPKTLRQLVAALPDMGFAQLQQAVTLLVGMGVVAPCQDDAAASQARKKCEALNRHICGRAAYSGDIETLASPVTGGGVSVSRMQQLFLLALAENRKQPQEWAQHVWRIIGRQGHKLSRDGVVLETAEANLAELNDRATEFAARRLPILKALQIV